MMKITLFLCAGNLAEALDIKKVSEMRGVGRRMPGTMAAFTIGALGMIGLPPLAGFVSKWYLASGSLGAGEAWVLPILLGSSLLNALYFLPILHAAWFEDPDAPPRPFRRRIGWMLGLPPIATASLVVAAGLLANAGVSPLGWTQFIISLEYL
jgi:multicomponent Na+:H+ antiporter subunit D